MNCPGYIMQINVSFEQRRNVDPDEASCRTAGVESAVSRLLEQPRKKKEVVSLKYSLMSF
jgi:hypothetical protein